MPTLTEKRIAAGERYAASVRELRESFAELAVLDEACNAPSFGEPPEIVPLRHPTFAPNVSGNFGDDIAAARARLQAAE